MLHFVIVILVVLLLLAIKLTFITIKRNQKLKFENDIIKIESYEQQQAIKDANHRVKNNLQLINSLLSYQAKEYKNIDLENFIIKGQKRINSIILLHENFDIGTNNNEVNLKKYIEDLFDFFTDLFEIQKTSIQFQLNTNEIKINLETALPLGIILNELICNSLLHAFPPGRKDNTISITIIRSEKNTYKLYYEDNGIGFSYKSKNGLGLKIIELLSNQMNANYFFDSGNGIKFNLIFKTVNQ